MNKKLYVGNLPYNVTEGELRELFAQAGQVTDAAVIIDRETGRSRGFGFVEMNTPEEATKAISQFNGHTMNNRQLQVSEARPREPRANNGGSDRGNYGGDRY
ncbi:MAG TPA: RNA-binding protein [Aggregatilineales bacterium]|nr:RNA-binding protein [Aggregatilineales bacterium]